MHHLGPPPPGATIRRSRSGRRWGGSAWEQCPRLRRLRLGTSNHEHDRRGERDDGERIVHRHREPFHGADRKRPAEAGGGALQGAAPEFSRARCPDPVAPSRAHPDPHKSEGRQIALPPSSAIDGRLVTSGWSSPSGRPRAWQCRSSRTSWSLHRPDCSR